MRWWFEKQQVEKWEQIKWNRNSRSWREKHKLWVLLGSSGSAVEGGAARSPVRRVASRHCSCFCWFVWLEFSFFSFFLTNKLEKFLCCCYRITRLYCCVCLDMLIFDSFWINRRGNQAVGENFEFRLKIFQEKVEQQLCLQRRGFIF